MNGTYEQQILNALLDSFERSKLSKEGTKITRSIDLQTSSKKPPFEKYLGQTGYLVKDDIDEAVIHLEKLGFVRSEFDPVRHLLKRVILNIDAADKAYVWLKREDPRATRINLLAMVKRRLSEAPENSVEQKFAAKIKEDVEAYKSTTSYFGDVPEFLLLCDLIHAIELQGQSDDDVRLRNFSKHEFSDSKLVERKASVLLRVFNQFGLNDFDDFEDLCNAYKITKNKGFVFVKHGLVFTLNGQTIDLDVMGTDFGFTEESMKTARIVGINVKKVITVENLTTYEYMKEDDAVVIYLGGYHNSMKRLLLEKIAECTPNLEWFHIGDIDWGGFNILMDLRAKTGLPFKPMLMGVPELKLYKNECAPLTSNDREKLGLLLDNPAASDFYETIQFMLVNGYKLEQESLLGI